MDKQPLRSTHPAFSAIRWLIVSFWLAVAVAKLIDSDSHALGRFLAIAFGGAEYLGPAVMTAGVAVELAAGFSVAAYGRKTWPWRASYGLASFFLILQGVFGSQSHCGCLGAFQVSWPTRLFVLASVATVSFYALRYVVQHSRVVPRQLH